MRRNTKTNVVSNVFGKLSDSFDNIKKNLCNFPGVFGRFMTE